MTADVTPDGWDTNRAAFLGSGRTLAAPITVEKGRCSNTPSYAEVSVTAFHKKLIVGADETVYVNVIAGKTESRAERAALRKRLLAPGRVEQAFEKVKNFWQETQARVKIKTPDSMLDTFVNNWLVKHVYTMGGTHSVRSLSIGFRNYIQDAIGMIYLYPEIARKLILKSIEFQMKSGECIMNWSASGHAHGKPKHVDTKIWLILATCFYAQETGDYDILKEKASFMDSPRRTTLLQRLYLALDKCWKDRGMYGLSLVGEGDWNDNLSGMGKGGKGVSVWMSEAVLWCLVETARLAGKIGDAGNASKYSKLADKMRKAINSAALDVDRYIMGYTDDATMVGGRKSDQVKLFLLPQSWAVLSGAASPAVTGKLMRAVKSRLSSPYGPLIMDKPFSREDRRLGAITFLARGMSENGPVYSHAAAFMLCSYGKAGYGDLLYRDLMRLPATTLAEPYVMSNFYRPAAVPRKHGATHRSWTTSTPNWLLRAVVDGMFGVRADYDELVFDPSIPRKWREAGMIRKIRGISFDVQIVNPEGVQHGVREVWIDGRRYKGNRVPFPRSGKHCSVKVVMG
jgi:cellobionic acid phosphorylase